MRSLLFTLFAIPVLMTAGSAATAADESQVQLKPGDGAELVKNNCATCHSLDYIQMNSPFLDHKGWQAEANKMINAYHAPIDKSQVPAIVDYLAKYYGVEASPGPTAATPGAR